MHKQKSRGVKDTEEEGTDQRCSNWFWFLTVASHYMTRQGKQLKVNEYFFLSIEEVVTEEKREGWEESYVLKE